MGIFGKPNVMRMFNRSNCIGLIKALDNSDLSISRDADAALRKLADDNDKKIQRKENWLIVDYDLVLKRIEKKGLTKHEVVEHLVKVFNEENEAPSPILKLDKYFKDFGGLSANVDNNTAFIKEINSILEEDEWFEYSTRLPGKHYASSCGGILATNKTVLYFDIGLGYKLIHLKYTAISSLNYFRLDKVLKIEGPRTLLEFPIGDDENLKNLASYIEARVSNIKK